MQTMSERADVWSTVRIRMIRVGTDEEALAAASERLEGLAALLADHEGVGGVEVRDPSLITRGPEFVAVEQPELIAYTTPDQRPGVEAAARGLGELLSLELALDAEDHEGEDWRDAWKRYYRSLYFRPRSGQSGRALMIRPSWIPRQPDDPMLELVLDPGRAFGTGLHESTRLCLSALVDFERSFRSVLDLGCGSGILGLAAARLWPNLETLRLTDHDPEAVATAQENAALNALDTSPALGFAVVDLLADAEVALDEAELVLANIRPRVLIPAAAKIAAAAASGGVVVLSGILSEEAEAVRSAYAGLLSLDAQLEEGGWTALLMSKAGEP